MITVYIPRKNSYTHNKVKSTHAINELQLVVKLIFSAKHFKLISEVCEQFINGYNRHSVIRNDMVQVVTGI